jgi:hypothetical protein
LYKAGSRTSLGSAVGFGASISCAAGDEMTFTDLNVYRVSHSGLASEDLCGRALGWTLHPTEKTFPIIIT